MAILKSLSVVRRFRTEVKAFQKDEDGALIIFSLYIFICMMLAVGLALDTVRFEHTRAKLQATLDRAVLAAADLEQELPAKAVVEDFFEKAGLSEQLVDVKVKQGFNYKTVSATSQAEVSTMFLDMVGMESMTVPASGTADESLEDMEIALVLDVSGSMGENDDERLNLLKPAAKQFIDAVIQEEEEEEEQEEGAEGTGDEAATEDFDEGDTTIAIVPFATHVTVGEDLLKQYAATNEHDASHCVTFDSSDYTSTVLKTNNSLQRVAHFDPYTSSWDLSWPACETDTSRDIALWSRNPKALKAKIQSLTARGATSIEIGTKWGVTMLDPGSQDVLADLVDKEVVEEEIDGQPYNYGRENTRKILVVMSDGENTSDYDLKDAYREGPSSLYRHTESGNTQYSYYYNRSGTSYDYYSRTDKQWRNEPDGGDSATRLDWAEVWADMSVIRFSYEFPFRARGGSYMNYYYNMVDVASATTKNDRTQKICQAAKDAGILIFTIGMDTYGQGDKTLSECATLPTYFYDVRAIDISNAFASIALQINQLRLTH